MTPEQTTIFTPSHLKYFHTVLVREFTAQYRTKYDKDASPEFREYYNYWHASLCIGIMNLLPNIATTETLDLLKKYENTPLPYPDQSHIFDVLKEVIPRVTKRVQQITESGTLLRPADIEAEKELLRPLSRSPKEDSELLLRVAQSEEEIPQRASHGTES